MYYSLNLIATSGFWVCQIWTIVLPIIVISNACPHSSTKMTDQWVFTVPNIVCNWEVFKPDVELMRIAMNGEEEQVPEGSWNKWLFNTLCNKNLYKDCIVICEGNTLDVADGWYCELHHYWFTDARISCIRERYNQLCGYELEKDCAVIIESWKHGLLVLISVIVMLSLSIAFICLIAFQAGMVRKYKKRFTAKTV